MNYYLMGATVLLVFGIYWIMSAPRPVIHVEPKTGIVIPPKVYATQPQPGDNAVPVKGMIVSMRYRINE